MWMGVKYFTFENATHVVCIPLRFLFRINPIYIEPAPNYLQTKIYFLS
jgi:hypothetical protein